MSRNAARRAPVPEVLVIDAAAHDGRGIAHAGGKVVFVDGALPGETVTVLRRRRRRGYDEGELVEIRERSPRRVEPQCVHFGVCGGCSMQHAEPALQLEIKQRALADNLARIGQVRPARWLEPLSGAQWQYRRRARLSCRYVEKKGRLLVGFRERGRSLVADLSGCEVLAAPVGNLVAPLAEMLGGLGAARAIAQVEVAVADNATVLVLRHLEALAEGDRDTLRAFAAKNGVEFWLQPGGYDTVAPLDGPGTRLNYRLPAYDTTIEFAPTDFVQVNGPVNERMVDAALAALEVDARHAVLDLFCGLGNFSLPLARRAAAVTGVEGDLRLVQGARDNGLRNGIDNTEFQVADLFAPLSGEWTERRYDRVLLDPPRAGAREVLQWIPRWAPERIVYVSCHPGTLARDAGELVNSLGYRLAAAGIIDMFPHTAHVESIAVFERG